MDRREFLTGTAASGLMLLKPKTAFGYQANSAVRYALLGCGNRGTSVATSFAKNTSARIVALADIFPDQLEKGKAYFDDLNKSLGYAGPDHQFRGYKASEELAASKDVDAVQISTPPFFHVQHLEAMVQAGKHAYCEKPVGVDISANQTGSRNRKEPQRKGQRRRRLPDSQRAALCRNRPPHPQRRPRQNRQHRRATTTRRPPSSTITPAPPPTSNASATGSGIALSPATSSSNRTSTSSTSATGSLQSHPVKALATGGRNVITHAGDTWDNYQVIFTYPDDVHVSFSSTQFCPGNLVRRLRAHLRRKGHRRATLLRPAAHHRRQPVDMVRQQRQRPAIGQQPTGSFAANGAFSDNLAQADSEKDKGLHREHHLRQIPQPDRRRSRKRPQLHARPHVRLPETRSHLG